MECRSARRKRDTLRNNRERLNAVLKIQSSWMRSCTVEIRNRRKHARKCRFAPTLLLCTFFPFCLVVYLRGLFGVNDFATGRNGTVSDLLKSHFYSLVIFDVFPCLKSRPVSISVSICAGNYLLDMFTRLLGKGAPSSLKRDLHRAKVAMEITTKSRSMKYSENMKKEDVSRRSKIQKYQKETIAISAAGPAIRNIGIIQSMRHLRLNCMTIEFETVHFLLFSFWEEIRFLTEFDGAVESWIDVQHMCYAILYFSACFSLLHNSASSKAIVQLLFLMLFFLSGKLYFWSFAFQLGFGNVGFGNAN